MSCKAPFWSVRPSSASSFASERCTGPPVSPVLEKNVVMPAVHHVSSPSNVWGSRIATSYDPIYINRKGRQGFEYSEQAHLTVYTSRNDSIWVCLHISQRKSFSYDQQTGAIAEKRVNICPIHTSIPDNFAHILLLGFVDSSVAFTHPC
jgi:hypothetical protein